MPAKVTKSSHDYHYGVVARFLCQQLQKNVKDMFSEMKIYFKFAFYKT